jgi:WD40 repeat protein
VRDLHGKDPSAASFEFVAKGHGLRTLEISPDGRWAVGLNSGGEVLVWRLPSATVQNEPRILGGSGFAISHTGKWLAITGGDAIRLWRLDRASWADTPLVLNLDDSRTITERIEKSAVLTFSEDERYLFAADVSTRGKWENSASLIVRWDLGSLKPSGTKTILFPDETQDSDDFELQDGKPDGRRLCRPIAVSPDAHWLVCAVGKSASTARVWDLTHSSPTTTARPLSGHDAKLVSAVFSADSRWVVTASEDGDTRLWDLSSTDPVTSVAVVRYPRPAETPWGVHVQFYAPLGWPRGGYENWPPAATVCLSPDGSRLVTPGKDHAIQVFDLDVDRLIAAVRRRAGRELSVKERQQFLLRP